MEDIKEHLKDISEIRAMMERNSKFLSLSGLSGVSAGVCALVGAAVAAVYMGIQFEFLSQGIPWSRTDLYAFFGLDAGLVIVFAVGLAAIFSRRMAKKKNLPLWNGTSKLLLINLLIPLVTGGIFCLILIWHENYGFIPAAMLLFYGMALLNASKFTLPEMRYLAITELILGLVCAVWIWYSLIFWALGFGIAHIAYGAWMYFKYER